MQCFFWCLDEYYSLNSCVVDMKLILILNGFAKARLDVHIFLVCTSKNNIAFSKLHTYMIDSKDLMLISTILTLHRAIILCWTYNLMNNPSHLNISVENINLEIRSYLNTLSIRLKTTLLNGPRSCLKILKCIAGKGSI